MRKCERADAKAISLEDQKRNLNAWTEQNTSTANKWSRYREVIIVFPHNTATSSESHTYWQALNSISSGATKADFRMKDINAYILHMQHYTHKRALVFIIFIMIIMLALLFF